MRSKNKSPLHMHTIYACKELCLFVVIETNVR